MIEKIKEILQNYKRVLVVSSKPSLEEFKSSAKICAIGTIIIGVIGFILYLISVLVIG